MKFSVAEAVLLLLRRLRYLKAVSMRLIKKKGRMIFEATRRNPGKAYVSN